MKPEHITAWALDEVSAEERAHIEAALRENPDTGEIAHETKEFCAFLLTELHDESLALTPEQRERLQITKTPQNVIQPSFSAQPARWSFASRFGPIAAAAACAVLGGFLMVEGMKPKTETVVALEPKEKEFRVQHDRRGNAGQYDSLAARGPSGPVLGSPIGAVPAPSNQASSSAMFADVETLDVKPGAAGEAAKALADAMARESATSTTSLAVLESGALNILPAPVAPASSSMPVSQDQMRSLQATAGGVLAANGRSVNERNGEYQVLPEDKWFRSPVVSGSAAADESYTAIVENELKDVLREPLSTFSIDVDTASYANVRRFLNQNMIPPKDAVRIEELVNYFPTNEEGPAADAKEPFATRVELAACPWQPRHKLARISIQGREIEKNSKISNLVFLVDVSGSMNEPQKLPLVQQSLRMLAEQLGEADRVAMVTYASGTQVVLPPTNGQNRAQIIAAVDQLRAGGSTNGAGGLQLAYEQAVAGFVQGGINRVILCTDGDFNVGISDPAQLEKFIADKARSGVFLSVLGFGSGNLKDRTMETLADKGNGNYAYIDGLAEARKVLVEQMSGTLVTIAKDVKIQIEFNPALVRSYRLIGYENRLLAKEDFNDDTKDAGEIGSGHSVVALYELVPANLPPGEEPARIVDTLKYQTLASPLPDGAMPKLSATAKDSKEIMTVKLRYKQPEGETSQKIEVPVRDADKAITAASAEFKFSTAVAAFGLLLRDSSYKGTLTWEIVRKLALEGKGPDSLGYRGEFLQLIDKAAGLKNVRP